jgi:hypothetical protein
MKKVRAAFNKSQGQVDLDQLEYDLGAVEEDGEDEDEDEDFDIADTVGKALALIKQVSIPGIVLQLHPHNAMQIRKSPQARAFFKQSCVEVNVPQLELLQWVQTRWASLHDFLDRIIKLQKVCHSDSSYSHTITCL